MASLFPIRFCSEALLNLARSCCRIKVKEIEAAVSQLSPPELSKFRSWFAEFDAAAWDKQFAEDVAAGRLNPPGEEALRDLHQGRCTDLGNAVRAPL